MGIASFSHIKEFCEQITSQFHPDRIILFGSYAYGEPTPDSDVDLLVIMTFEGRSIHQEMEIRRSTRAPFALDLLVKTPQKVKERLDMGDFFMRDIMEKGKILYEADYARMD